MSIRRSVVAPIMNLSAKILLALHLLACGAATAGPPTATGSHAPAKPIAKRSLQLPSIPFNYSEIAIPAYAAEAAKRFDNTPADNPITDAGATLGRVLFYDKTLSANGTTSCASCHKQSMAFTDDRKLSVGFDGVAGDA